MITVTTAPSVINNLTPMTEGVTNNSAGTAAISNVDFTNALNAQLTATTTSANVATTTPILDESALLAVQTALLAATAESSENNQTTTASATQQNTVATTALTTQQPVVLTESVPSVTPTLLTASNANASTPEIAITSEDSEILSNVTDMLKFIATGAKLGDTLPEGQVIHFQNVNASTPLTQQTVQAAVQQSVNTTPVNTPAAVLAQQAMPAKTGEISSNPQTQIQSAETLDEVVVLDIQNKIATETAANTKQTIEFVTPTQVRTIQTEPVETATLAQAQTVQTEKPVMTATPVQAQTVQTEKPVMTATLVQGQTVQTEKPVVTVTPTQAQTVQTEKVVGSSTPTQAQTVQTEKPVVTATPAQAQTVQIEKSGASITPAPVVQSEKMVSTTIIAQTQNVQTEKSAVTVATQEQQTVVNNSVQGAATVENITPERSVIGEIPDQHLQNESVVKNSLKSNEPVNADESVQSEESLVSQMPITPTFVQNENVVTSENPGKSSNKNAEQTDSLQEERILETPLPLVTAQAAPVQAEADVATFDTPSSSTPLEDKPTLTPAKNLLADVLASRNNAGDTANNSGDKKGGDTQANSASLLADNSAKNTLDNKTFETKSFANLLNAEKSDATSALSATTNDKVAPQVAAAAVNKLAQDMKTDVPALTRPLSHPNWNQEVGERIIWMNNRGISSAEIRMNPQNMGPLTVRIDVNADQQTSVSFTAQNADVRTALEASIPRLREMLNSQNLNLADVNVSQQSSTGADSNGSQRQNAQMAADASASGQGNRQSNQEVDTNGNPIRQVDANGEEIAVDEFANGQVIEGNGTNGMLSLFA